MDSKKLRSTPGVPRKNSDRTTSLKGFYGWEEDTQSLKSVFSNALKSVFSNLRIVGKSSGLNKVLRNYAMKSWRTSERKSCTSFFKSRPNKRAFARALRPKRNGHMSVCALSALPELRFLERLSLA
jgi:hypothetical protein